MKSLIIVAALIGLTIRPVMATAEEKIVQKPPQPDFHETLKAPLDPRLSDYKPVAQLAGSLRMVGADTMENVARNWIESFTKIYPKVHIDLDAKEVTPGVIALTDGTADMIPIAREPLPKEKVIYEQKFGRLPLAVEVGGGPFRKPGKSPAIVFYVNKENPIDKLTLAQLDAIISTTRKRGYKEDITTWGQLGATGDFAQAPIHIYSIKRPNGIPHNVELNVSLGGEFRDTTREMVSDSNSRVLFRIAEAVADDRYGIGYGSLLHLNANNKVLALAEKEGGPYYEPTFENVLNRKYPLSRPIYIYLNREPQKPLNPLVHEFMKYVLSKQGQDDVIREGIMLPLSAEAAKRELSKIE